MPGLVLPQCRPERQVAVGHIVDDDRSSFVGGSAEQALAWTDFARNGRVARHAMHRGAQEVVPAADEHGAGHGAGIAREEIENAVAQLLDRAIAHHGGAEPDFARLQPFLAAARRGGAPDEEGDDRGQQQPQDAGKQCAEQRALLRPVHFGEAQAPDPGLFLRDGGDLRPDGVHVELAGIRSHQRQRRCLLAGAPEVDRLRQFGELGVDILAQDHQPFVLPGIDRGHPADLIELRRD